MDSLHGQVYAKSDKFSIYSSEPSGYVSPGTLRTRIRTEQSGADPPGVPVATVTATISTPPNPTQQWALTLNGENPEVTTTVQIAGNAGSGSS